MNIFQILKLQIKIKKRRINLEFQSLMKKIELKRVLGNSKSFEQRLIIISNGFPNRNLFGANQVFSNVHSLDFCKVRKISLKLKSRVMEKGNIEAIITKHEWMKKSQRKEKEKENPSDQPTFRNIEEKKYSFLQISAIKESASKMSWKERVIYYFRSDISSFKSVLK